MKKNKQGFSLALIIIFTVAFGGIALTIASALNDGGQNHYIQFKKIQASNYAVEGLELVKGYVATEINKDKKNAWRNIIQPLSGTYKVGFSNGEYSLVSQTLEVIEKDYPYLVDYERIIEIFQGDSIDEKKVSVYVSYGEGNSKISYDTTLVNLYGD